MLPAEVGDNVKGYEHKGANALYFLHLISKITAKIILSSYHLYKCSILVHFLTLPKLLMRNVDVQM